MRGKVFSLFAVVVSLLACGGPAGPGGIRGIVTDPSGAVVSGPIERGSYALQIGHKEAIVGALQISIRAPGFAPADSALDFSQSPFVGWSVRLEIASASEQAHVEAKSLPFEDQLDISEIRDSSAKDVGEALTAVDG